MWNWLTRRIGPATASGVAAAWLIVSGNRARARHEAAWRAFRERDRDGLTRFQREAEARARARLEDHGVTVLARQVERDVWASGTPALTVILRTSRPDLTITLEEMEASITAAGETRTAEEWDTPSSDQAFLALLAAVEWGVHVTAPSAI